MQLVLLLLWIKAAQGLYLGRKKSESLGEDVSILHTYNAVVHGKSKDELPVLPFSVEEKAAKPTKRKNLKKIISKGKVKAETAGKSPSYNLHGMETTDFGDSTFGAKFVPKASVDGYEGEAESEQESLADVTAMEDIEDSDEKENSDKEVAEGSEDEGSEDDSDEEEGSDNEVAEGSEEDYEEEEHDNEVAEGSEEGSEDEEDAEEGSEDESEDSSDSSSSDSSSSESSSSDSDSSSSDSSSSSSSSSSSDSEDDEKVPDYYNGEPDYVYTYEWDDTDKQVTGSDYEYTYEWAHVEEDHNEHYE